MRAGNVRRKQGDRAEFDRLTVLGWSITRIAAELGVDPRTVCRWRKDAGLSHPRPGVHLPASPERLLRAAELLADGCSYGEVGRTLHMGHDTLRRHFPGTGWGRSEASVLNHVVQRLNKQIERLYN